VLGNVGNIFTGLSLVATLYTAFATGRSIVRQDAARWQSSGKRALHAATALLGVAVFVLAGAFLSHRFEIRYVAQHSSLALPPYLRLSAVWAGQEGSLLLWSFLQALFAVLAVERSGKRARPLVPWATVFLSVIAAFFTAVTLFLSNPFTQTAHTPVDGMGLNPLLRHPGMIFHPPAMYVGYVGLAVPFAFALAALVTGRVQRWTRAIRSWTLIAWLGLGLGLLLGMRWAYDVLGWGGYWGWDPVENAGLMPWFTTTALVHGAVMQDERRGFRLWNFLLVIFSFVLVLFGTYATRSGAIQSVHAYARSNLGGVYLTAIGATLVGALGLVIWRRSLLQSDDPPEEGLLSRAGVFTLTLMLFSTLTVSVFVGSILPTLSQRLTGQAFEAGPDWFDRVTGPQFAALLLLLGVCPVLGRSAQTLRRLKKLRWIGIAGPLIVLGGAVAAGFARPLSLLGFALVGFAGATALAEFAVGVRKRVRQRDEALLNALWGLFRTQQRKYGGYLVHVGIILMAVGVIGTRMYPVERDVVLAPGESVTVGAYTFTLEGLNQEVRADYLNTWANVSLARGSEPLTTLAPKNRHYANYEQSYGIPAVRPGLREDVYLILAGWSEDQRQVTFKVLINALANFLWLGGLVFLAGGTLAFWPRRGRRDVWHVIGGAVALALLLGAAWSIWIAPQGQAAEIASGRPRVGEMAPDFRLTLLDGSTVSLSELQGEIVILNIWASWCPPCTEELPALQSIWSTYQDANVIFVGAAYRETEADVRETVAAYGLTYPIGLDTQTRIAKAYGITGVPETFVIGADGRVAYVHIGPVTAEQLSQEVESLVRSTD